MSKSYCDYDDDFDDIDVTKITHIYQLRHACHVIGFDVVYLHFKEHKDRVKKLYHSRIHGSKGLDQFLNCSDEKFVSLFRQYQQEEDRRQRSIEEVQNKNERLIKDLKTKRHQFANIGTNKAKRRLNKLALSSVVAKAVRVAIEIEDKSISAKDSYYTYKEKIYRQKHALIMDLCVLFKDNNWVYGIHKSDVPGVTHVIFFEIPGCEQISWHFSPESAKIFPIYSGVWDGKEGTTLNKLEAITMKLLS